MRARKGLTLLIGAALLLGLAPGALAQSSSSSAQGAPVVFTFGVSGDLNSANPFKQIDVTEYFVGEMMYRSLLRLGQADYAIEGDMADSWETSEDGLTWTFHLRDGLVWSDGVPITSQDFKWTANFIMENRLSNYLDGYTDTKSIETPDSQTIVWTTTKPTLVPGLPGRNLILPEHVWSTLTPAEAKQYRNYPDAVISGPYNITEWKQGESWKMVRNPAWWGTEPTVDTFVFRIYGSEESALQALQKGAIDFTVLGSPDLYENIKDKPGIDSAVDSAEAFQQLSFNVVDDPKSTAHPAVLDVNFRRAVEYAIDRNELIERVLLGYGEPGTTPIPPIYSSWHWQPPEEELISFNLDKANQILEEAGYADTDGDGVREMPNGGPPLNLRLYTEATDTVGIQIVPFLKSWLSDIGVEISTRTMTDTKLYDLWYDFDWDMIIYSWSTGPDPDGMLSTFTQAECGNLSDTCYTDPEYEQLYKEQRTALDVGHREEIVDQMQQILYRDSPEIVLWYPNSFEAWRGDRWEGFLRWPEPDGVALWLNLYSAMSIKPIAGASETTSGGIPAWVWAAVGVVVVGAIVGGVASRRRKKKSGEGYYA